MPDFFALLARDSKGVIISMKYVQQQRDWQRLRWQCQSRYYEIILHQTLFGDWIVTRSNGTVNESNGQVRHMPADSYSAAIDILIAIARRRAVRGYHYVPIYN